MIETTIEAVAHSSPPTITPDASVTDAARALRRPDVEALPVLDDGTVVGIVTDSDLVALIAETDGRPTVQTVMSSPVATVAPTATVSAAADRMREAGVKHLPVADDAYHGVVSVSTLAPYLPRHALDTEWQGDPIRIESSDCHAVTDD